MPTPECLPPREAGQTQTPAKTHIKKREKLLKIKTALGCCWARRAVPYCVVSWVVGGQAGRGGTQSWGKGELCRASHPQHPVSRHPWPASPHGSCQLLFVSILLYLKSHKLCFKNISC